MQIMEKYCDIFDAIPSEQYRSMFGDKTDSFLELKILKSKIKAKFKQNENALKRLADEDDETETLLQIEAEERMLQEEPSYNITAQSNRATSKLAYTINDSEDDLDMDGLLKNN